MSRCGSPTPFPVAGSNLIPFERSKPMFKGILANSFGLWRLSFRRLRPLVDPSLDDVDRNWFRQALLIELVGVPPTRVLEVPVTARSSPNRQEAELLELFGRARPDESPERQYSTRRRAVTNWAGSRVLPPLSSRRTRSRAVPLPERAVIHCCMPSAQPN